MFLLTKSSQASRTALKRAVVVSRCDGLLTPKRMRCSFLVESGQAGDVVTVDVRERYNKRCGGDLKFAPRMFSLELNSRTGAVRWDNTPGMEMSPIPQRSRLKRQKHLTV